MALKSDLPPLFVVQMDEILGPESEEFYASLEAPSPVSVRYNRRKIKDFRFDNATPVPHSLNGVYLSERPNFTLMPELHAGLFYVQEASSMVYERIVAELVQHLQDEGVEKITVLDSCAAPGGKSTAAINALPDDSFLLANEFDRRRANILYENLAKWGFPNTAVSQGDTVKLKELGPVFDIVMVDAPCSGEGMMRKEPKAVEQWCPALVRQCSMLQREILDNVVPTLKPGGYLIYSTCTYNREEDEMQVEYLKKNFNLESVNTEVLESNAKHFYPHKSTGEGLFVAVFRKPEEEIAASKREKKGKRGGKGRKEPIFDPREWRIPKDFEPLCERLQEKLNLISLGVKVGEVKGKDLVPSAVYSLSGLASEDGFPMVNLSREEALRYLHRETILLPEGTPKGYVQVGYNGNPLGFVKNLGNRCNNLWPQEWRIRQEVAP